MTDILNYQPSMTYRRFGKTNKQLSVITLGGMRFKHGWDEPRREIPAETLDQCINTVQMAFNAGINHIESAWGYKKSESVYGKTLNEELRIPRESYHLMTKGSALTSSEMRKMVETQLKDLQTSYLDFYGWHGINNNELLQQSCKTGGPVEELLKLKEEGLIRHIGFSTHARVETIVDAIETGLFEFVNLHYYYFNQSNFEAVNAARDRDMGVFIISPNDKGGQLFKAPIKVKKATSPSTPIQWNARFCLQNPAVHTLSFGMTEESHFDEMEGIFPVEIPWSESDKKSKEKLDSFVSDDPFAHYDGVELNDDPSGINIQEILRLRKLWKCYNMQDYGKYRYKLFKNNNHWLPGAFATNDNINKINMSRVPDNIPLQKMLKESHKAFYVPEYKMINHVARKLKKMLP